MGLVVCLPPVSVTFFFFNDLGELVESFCGLALTLGLRTFFSLLDWGDRLGKEHHRGEPPFSSYRRHPRVVTGGVTDHSGAVGSARLLHCRVTVPPVPPSVLWSESLGAACPPAGAGAGTGYGHTLQVLVLGSFVSAPPLLVSPREFGSSSSEDGISNLGCVLLPLRS